VLLNWDTASENGRTKIDSTARAYHAAFRNDIFDGVNTGSGPLGHRVRSPVKPSLGYLLYEEASARLAGELRSVSCCSTGTPIHIEELESHDS
jgi:hypothetical protein